ncbi:MAG TPA: UvrD-helicase domain-containing protein, partial [Pseudomonadales bacterium]|nr:UvrD-helicase domain-containing protein [Pseudomonadales bacterium]
MSKTDSDSPTIKSTFKLSQVIIEGLSEEQYVAASSTALSSLVLAGAGTGKTRTLIGRLAYLFQQEESQTSNILMLAFARKAAVEMRERIDDLLPMISEGVQVNTFHSLGLYIVAKVKGTVPQLTELSEAGAMEHFIRHGFFELCAKDANYLTAYYKWLSIASITPSNNQLFRSLHDEYVDNRAELICANLLYQFRVDYLYKTHYAKPHTWERYKSYQPGFYLPAQDIYLEVYDVSAASLSEQQVERRQKSSDIHAAHKTKCIELFLDSDLEHFYQQIYALLSDFSSRKSTKSKHISLGRSAYHYESLVEQLVRWLPLFKYELSW